MTGVQTCALPIVEPGLSDAMGSAFYKALAEAKELNKGLDAEINAAADKIVSARQKDPQALKDLFAKPKGSPSKTDDASKVLEEESKETTSQIQQDFEQLGSSIEGKLVSSLDMIGGKFTSFKDLAKGIFSDINQILLKQALQGFGVTGQGGMVNSLLGSLGGMFGGGGAGAGVGIGSMISSAASMFGGFFADGGKLKPGQFGIVGERGPELAFAGNSPLNIMPNNSMAAAGAPVTVNMNIQTPDAKSFRQSQSQIAANMARAMERGKRNL